MFVPTFDNDVGVFVNHRFDLTEVVRFDALLFSENELCTVPLELGHAAVALHMDVHRLVFLAIKEEREPKNLKTSGIFLSFYCLFAPRIGIIFDTTNVSAYYLQ